MNERKKYLVNILSYKYNKYKKDSMKIFPSILSKNKVLNANIDPDLSIISNLCPGGKSCQNYIIIGQLERQIKSLNDTICQLKQINEYSDIKINDLQISELKINESSKSEKSEKNSELCNSFRNSSIKRSNSAFDDKINNKNYQNISSHFRTLTNDSENKNKGEFNYLRNRIKCFNLNKELKAGSYEFSESEKKILDKTKINSYKIFQSNFINKKNLSQKFEQKDNNEVEKINKGFINNNKIFFRNKNDIKSDDKNKEIEPCSSPPIKILKNNVFGIHNNNNSCNNNISQYMKTTKTSDNEKNSINNNNKINYYIGLKPFRALRSSIKFNLNYINDKKSKQKTAQFIADNDNKSNNKNINNSKNNDFIINEFNLFIKNYEYKSNYKNGDLIYQQLYELTLPKDKTLLDSIKSLSDENIYKYSSLINYCLKYIKSMTSFIQKIKYLCNNCNSTGSNTLDNKEFDEFKEECKNLLKCEKVNIYNYDTNSDCLILKEGNDKIKYQKDKDLIGLSFSLCKKIRHDPNISNSNISSIIASEERLNMKINNLLIFPIKDKEKKVYGCIEVINKLKEEENNKSYFDKNDELLLDLLTINIGNYCKYLNIVESQKRIIEDYKHILEFWNKILFRTNLSPSLYFIMEEVTKLMKKIFGFNEIQFFLFINHNLFDIQKNKFVKSEGLVHKCLQEKKLIYTSNPLSDKNYKINIDLPVIISEQLITFPVFCEISNDNNNSIKPQSQNMLIIQIKVKNKELNLNEENIFIIEYTSYLIQKYLSENKELINKYKYLI